VVLNILRVCPCQTEGLRRRHESLRRPPEASLSIFNYIIYQFGRFDKRREVVDWVTTFWSFPPLSDTTSLSRQSMCQIYTKTDACRHHRSRPGKGG